MHLSGGSHIFVDVEMKLQPQGTMARKTSSAVLQVSCFVMNPKASTGKKKTRIEKIDDSVLERL